MNNNLIILVVAGVSIALLVYFLHNKSSHPPSTLFQWKMTDSGVCSQPCGGGWQYPQYQCVASDTGAVAPVSQCASLPPPPDKIACNTNECQWQVGPWSECKASDGSIVTCGKDGFGSRTREVVCPKAGGCSGSAPASTDQCPDLQYCAWNVSPWNPSDCSSLVCGQGSQTRTVTCPRETSGCCDPSVNHDTTQTCDTGHPCAWKGQTVMFPYPVPSNDRLKSNIANQTTLSFVLRNNQSVGLTGGARTGSGDQTMLVLSQSPAHFETTSAVNGPVSGSGDSCVMLFTCSSPLGVLMVDVGNTWKLVSQTTQPQLPIVGLGYSSILGDYFLFAHQGSNPITLLDVDSIDSSGIKLKAVGSPVAAALVPLKL
jgi:hypothetical protein